MKFINRSNKTMNRTILHEVYKIISCKTGWTILNAILSCGNKLRNFENSKTHDIVGRNLLEILSAMLIVINSKLDAGADFWEKEREREGGGRGVRVDSTLSLEEQK